MRPAHPTSSPDQGSCGPRAATVLTSGMSWGLGWAMGLRMGPAWQGPCPGRAGLWEPGECPCCGTTGQGLLDTGADVGSWALGMVGEAPGTRQG